jgi:surface carbohydrate biosynthesis protein
VKKGQSVRFTFTKPSQARVVIYDATGAEIIARLFDSTEQISVLDTRLEVVNIRVLFQMLFMKGFRAFGRAARQHAYVDAFLSLSKPQLVATFIDNDPNFYSLAARNDFKFKTAFFQNGRRFKLLDVFSRMEVNPDWHVDHMFVFSQQVGNLYSESIAGQVHALGSLKNNFATRHPGNKNRELLWLSGWEPFDPSPKYASDIDGRSISYSEYFEMDAQLLKHVADWCLRNDFKLRVAGRSSDPRGAEWEHFKVQLDSLEAWVFQSRSTPFATYAAIDGAELSVSLDSTVSYEALARGAKIALFPWRYHTLKSDSSPFCWPVEVPDEGPFWATDVSKEAVDRVLDFVSLADPSEWALISERYLESVMLFDEGNKRTSKILISILKTEDRRSRGKRPSAEPN